VALDRAAQGMRASTVCPAFCSTRMAMGWLTVQMREQIAILHPLGRMVEPEEVAEAVLFLASKGTSSVTGICLFVDGGYAAK
jgi:NAD(P)-dependent dehydrogenase (short-subunit alcohol dehydrogenase family)